MNNSLEDVPVSRLVMAVAGISLTFGVAGGALLNTLIRREVRVVTEQTTEIKHVHKTVERVETIEYANRRIEVPPLDDPRQACSGAVVRIIKLDVSDPDKETRTTWLIVRPVGDGYTVSCRREGNYANYWKEGQVVRLYGAKLDDGA